MKNVLILVAVIVVLIPEVVPLRFSRFRCKNRWWGRWSRWCRKTITYQVINAIEDPTFDIALNMTLRRGQPFIRYMERAADMDGAFNFSANYHSALGYFITTINNLTANFNEDGTWWKFILAPDTMLPVGVSTYKPKSGDHIIFNFTQS